MFEIDPAQPNFQRDIEIQGEKGNWTGSGEISRVHMQRGRAERLMSSRPRLISADTGHGALKAVIHNGDDAPLKISGARLEQYERRIYFDAAAGVPIEALLRRRSARRAGLRLRQTIPERREAGPMELGAEAANAAYTGRPDDGRGQSAIRRCCGRRSLRRCWCSAGSR